MDINDQIAYIKRLPVSTTVIESILHTEYPHLFPEKSIKENKEFTQVTDDRDFVTVVRKRKKRNQKIEIIPTDLDTTE